LRRWQIRRISVTTPGTSDKLFEEFSEPHYGAPPLPLRMVEAGQLGKKSRQGIYKY
jgi:3-hydroxyacyl-CoA dehydrogenase